MLEFLMGLMLQTSKFQNFFLENPEILQKHFAETQPNSFMVSPHQETEFHIRAPAEVRRLALLSYGDDAAAVDEVVSAFVRARSDVEQSSALAAI